MVGARGSGKATFFKQLNHLFGPSWNEVRLVDSLGLSLSLRCLMLSCACSLIMVCHPSSMQETRRTYRDPIRAEMVVTMKVGEGGQS